MTMTHRLADFRILLVEDEYLQADDTRCVLEGHGAEVLGPFRSPRDALEAAVRANCAVIDINLGSGPDFRAAEALEARGVPFAFLTGYDRSLLPDGFAGRPFLQKPVASDRLVEAVARLARPASAAV